MRYADTNREEREHLGFAEGVVKNIEPVLTPFSFDRTEMSPYSVQYQSPSVAMQVSHNPISYEIDVVFWRRAAPSERVNLGDIFQASREAGSTKQVFFQASTSDRVDSVAITIAELLRKHGTDVLAGDPAAYRRIAEDARDRNAAYTKGVAQKPIRDAAEEAWRKRDYAKVRNLYESIISDLTPVEEKRLEYASSHSSG